MSEICNECGASVAIGEGRYVNRVADENSVPERIEADKLFPEGDFICSECDGYQCGVCNTGGHEFFFVFRNSEGKQDSACLECLNTKLSPETIIEDLTFGDVTVKEYQRLCDEQVA